MALDQDKQTAETERPTGPRRISRPKRQPRKAPVRKARATRTRRTRVISREAAQDALLLLNQAARARSDRDTARLVAMAHKRLQDG